MKRVLLALFLLGCNQPAIEETPVTFNSPPPQEVAIELGPEEVDCGELVDPIEREWCMQQHPSEQEQVAAGVLAAPMLREARLRRAVWVVPADRQELRGETIAALLRVTISEEGWNYPPGARMLYQTALTNRGCMGPSRMSVRCSRTRRRRAPVVTALWRNSPRATGRVETTRRRQQWIPNVLVDCSEPEAWPGGDHSWGRREARCEALVAEITRIVDGESTLAACPSGSRPTTWGCDPFRRRALCDVLNRGCERVYDEDGNLRLNRHGVLRGCNDTPNVVDTLQRLDCGETENAVWCRPGTPHCGTLPESERVLHERLRLAEERLSAEDELRDEWVPEPQESVQRGADRVDGPVVLDLHGVQRNGERQAESPAGDQS